MTHLRSPRRSIAAALLTVALAACAPEAVDNLRATGFNAFLDRIAAGCKPLRIGTFDMGYAISRGSTVGDDYDYFLDQTSRLYYGRISGDAYRAGITGFFGPGADTSRSIDCIIGSLDAPPPPGAPPPARK